MSKLQENPQPWKQNIQHLKKWNLSTFFFVFALLDPDPDSDPGTPLNPDPIRIRIHNTG